MKKSLIFLMVLPLLAIFGSFAEAYPVSYEIEGDEEFSIYVASCANSACSTLGTVIKDDRTERDAHTYQIAGSGVLYTAEFDYADGFKPHAYIVTTDDSFSNGPHKEEIKFEEADECQAEIKSIKFDDSDHEEGDEVEITVKVESAFGDDAPSGMAIPGFLEDEFSSEVEVTVTITDEDGDEVADFKDDVDILYDTTEEIEFDWEADFEGEFEVTVRTEVTDEACDSSEEDEDSKTIEVDGDSDRGVSTSSSSFRSISLLSNSRGGTDFTVNSFKAEASPGDTIPIKVSITNDEGVSKKFTISAEKSQGIVASSKEIVVPNKATITTDYFIKVTNAPSGENLIDIYVDYNPRIARTIAVENRWDIDFEVDQSLDEENGLVIVNYTITNREAYSTKAELLLNDGENEVSEEIEVKPSGKTIGSVSYPSRSGNHKLKVEFRQADSILSTEEFSFSGGKSSGTTGLFVAGGSVLAGVLVLFLLLLLLIWYERRKHSEAGIVQAVKPILQSKPAPKTRIMNRYYDSIFSKESY